MAELKLATMLSGAIATGDGSPVNGQSAAKTYQASGATSAGAGAATIVVKGSNDLNNWDTIGTITLTLSTTSSSDGFTSSDRYAHVRMTVSAISGTNATVSGSMAY